LAEDRKLFINATVNQLMETVVAVAMAVAAKKALVVTATANKRKKQLTGTMQQQAETKEQRIFIGATINHLR